MLKKNQIFTVTAERLDSQMNAVAHIDGQTVFVPSLLPGEAAEIRIVKAEKRYAFARVERRETDSPVRQTPPCPFYARCGGCTGMHMRYEETLRAKAQTVQDALKRIGGIDMEVPLPLGMAEPFHYRNKIAMPVADIHGAPQAGYYRPRTHELVPIDHCMLAAAPSDEAVRAVIGWMREFGVPAYHESTGEGLIRHVVTRVNRRGKAMVTLATAAPAIPHVQSLCDRLMALPGVVSVCQTVNPHGDNVILGREYTVLAGDRLLTDELCGLTYQLSPLSFFQVNPSQTERLYETALRMADLRPEDRVADLYCGAGTISLLAARHAAHVTGIEVVPQAVNDAWENARRNGVSNVNFLCGPAESLLPGLVRDGLRPDVVLLDPPRKGSEPAVLDAIASVSPRRIVYVSCDPATLARDLKHLCAAGYAPQQVQPVDMFAWTSHVESVVKLTRAGL